MAWTSILYVFKSVLTSAKMTQNQANFEAVAQGLSGAPKILNAAFDDDAITKAKIAPGGTWPNAEIANLPVLGTNPASPRQTAIVNSEIDAAAAIAESKLNLNIATLALRDGSAITGGNGNTGNDYTLTFNPTFPALVNGMILVMSPSANNTGPSTLKVDSLAVINLKKVSRGVPVDLVTGDIKTPSRILVIYNSSASAFILLTPSQITDAMLSTNVALLSANQTASGNKIFSGDFQVGSGTPDAGGILEVIAASAGYGFNDTAQTTPAGRFQIYSSSDQLRIFRKTTGDIVAWDNAGEMTLGKIPLLRIRTAADAAVFDGSDVMIAGTVPASRITAGTAVGDIRINGGLGLNIAAPATDGDFAISGSMTAGTVPLARMATVDLVGTTVVSANTTSAFVLRTATDTHEFYIYSIRGITGETGWAQGADVGPTEVVNVAKHSFIIRRGVGANDSFVAINGVGGSSTVVYKVYRFTET